MKKFLMLFLILSVTALCIVPYSAAGEASSNVHLVNPTFIQSADNKLFIADNITDSESVVHVFDITSTPGLLTSVQFQGNIEKIRLFDNTLYVLQSDGYTECTVQQSQVTTGKKTAVYIKDIVKAEGSLYLLKEDALYDISGEKRTNESWDTSFDALYDGTYIRYTYTDDGVYYMSGVKPTGIFDAKKQLPSDTLGIAVTDALTYFTSNGMYTVDGATLFTVTADKIVSVATQGADVFVLSNNNKVYKYTLTDGKYVRDSEFVVGSDVVNYEVPELSSLTGFTLARSLGYPANIVYRTVGQYSVPQLIDDLKDTQYIILHYPDSDTCDYYYVFVNNSFGWIRKSGDTPETDSKIQVTDTVLNSVAQFNAKLMSANTYVYHLPVAEELKNNDFFEKQVITQQIDNPTDVKLLQKFTTTDGVDWYFVQYSIDGTAVTGFVPVAGVGKIYSTGLADDIVLDPQSPRSKINATLFEQVSVYLTSDLNEQEKTVFPGTEIFVELSSDTVVNILDKDNGATYIQVIYEDGSMIYGWVADKYLIPINSLTTNETAGLILFGTAAVLIAVFVVAFSKRKKHNDENAEDTQQ